MSEDSRPILETQASQTRFNMSQKMEDQKRKKVLVVGAGAAGKSVHLVFPLMLLTFL